MRALTISLRMGPTIANAAERVLQRIEPDSSIKGMIDAVVAVWQKKRAGAGLEFAAASVFDNRSVFYPAHLRLQCLIT